ncbi:MAG: sialate O-acetylesterase, partial [Terracidiphilus sp.]
MRILFASISLLLSSVTISAQVTLPRVLSSHMVIQRDLPVHVWGNAAPGQPVAVSFRDESRGTEADQLGHWSVYLKPGSAGGP